jgi:uncharacterized membrane protein YuzA (DUF378 family)
MKSLHMITFVLLVVGGLNWLLVAFNFNLVEKLLGTGDLTMVVYILVGLSALHQAMSHKSSCKNCSVSAPQM